MIPEWLRQMREEAQRDMASEPHGRLRVAGLIILSILGLMGQFFLLFAAIAHRRSPTGAWLMLLYAIEALLTVMVVLRYRLPGQPRR